ncbi:hypothetical protein [Haloarcula pelagica]|uniref:hypothetical protein n=1 Tax=Haloarcula pelagica TaxID=3033389 RepID=UPI0024C29863|nr:hypothetical protein [Halomicroarcula sp. YJ-61-S]
MYSRDHALGSLALGVVLLLVSVAPARPAVLLPVVVAIGVGIDFDHFLVAYLNTGSTKNLRRVVRDPRIVLLDQGAIFDPDDLSELQRLLSHAVLAGLAVFGLVALGEQAWAVVVGLTLYLHVLSDLVADVRKDARTERG